MKLQTCHVITLCEQTVGSLWAFYLCWAKTEAYVASLLHTSAVTNPSKQWSIKQSIREPPDAVFH